MPSSSELVPCRATRPVSRTVASSTTENARFAFCSTTTIATWASWRSRTTASYTRRAVLGASPREASSSSITRGLAMNARPTASICCSPPDSAAAFDRMRSARLGNRSRQ